MATPEKNTDAVYDASTLGTPKMLVLGTYGEHETFFTLKGELEAVLTGLRVKKPSYTAVRDNPTYHPGRCAKLTVEGVDVGFLGQLHPLAAQNYGLDGSHKVAFQYAVQHNFDYLIVLHGDDQGDIRDVLPLVHSGRHRKYDCCLGSRFMPESRIKGYSTLRVVGNYGFNWLFSLVAGHKITDLGSGLNLYAVPPLANGYYKKFPDTLYFNDCMILALCHLKQKVLFFPISWREEDQVSNNKLTSFGVSLLKLCGRYLKNKNEFVTREWREKPIEEYTSTIIASNL